MDVLGLNAPGHLLEPATAGSEEARLRRLQREAPDRESLESLRETAREFEAVFLNQLLKVMRDTVPENELFNSGGATKYYRQMHDAEIARAMATGRSGLGVADLIVQQFAANVRPDGGGEQPRSDEAGPRTALPPAPVAARPTGVEPVGPPAPPPGEVLGPPAPAAGPGAPLARPATAAPASAATAAATRYRDLAPIATEVAARARLRRFASAHSEAAADTLQRFGSEIDHAATRSGLDPSLVLAVVMAESGGDPVARSPKGAVGLMQLMPDTADEVGVADATSPAQNLRGGADYLARMLQRYDERLDLALAAYNAGPGNVDRAGRRVPSFPETRSYVRRVMTLYRDLGGGRHGGTEIATGGDASTPDHP